MSKKRKFNYKDIIKKLFDYIPEITIIIGVILISRATFIINYTAGLYTVGGILLIGGLFLAKGR